MAIQRNSYDGSSAAADPAGNASDITRIAGFIIIDTVVGGISGKGGSFKLDLRKLLSKVMAARNTANAKTIASKKLAAPAGSPIFLEIAPGRNISFINALPAGVTLQESFSPWSDAQIGVLNDEVYYIEYDGSKIKSNKIFPYAGFAFGSATDRIYVELNSAADTTKFYW